MIRIFHTEDIQFETEFKRIRNRGKLLEEPKRVVSKILKDVELQGDKALFRYTRKFDGATLNAQSVEATEEEIRQAIQQVPPGDLRILKTAADRIDRFHRKQIVKEVRDKKEQGIELGWLVRPVKRIGIYAPGGLAAYPSTVLMAAIPARVAGVKEIILVSPVKKDPINPLILAAAAIGGVHRIFKIGGAQAIAALAYGTESIPAVDKIVGPGNAYVTEAKRLVFGKVGIDMIAGPSEILIIADHTADARCVAADLLSQAEHDALASAILLTPSASLAKRVATQVSAQLERLSRKNHCFRVHPGVRRHYPDPGSRRSCQNSQPLCPGTSGAYGEKPGRPAAGHPPCGCDLSGRSYTRGHRRLPRRSQPYSSNSRDGAVFISSRRL